MANYLSGYPYGGYGGYPGGSHQYAYHLQEHKVQRVPSGVFFNLNQIHAPRKELESLEKGIDPFNIFPAFLNLDGGYASTSSDRGSNSSSDGETRCLPLLDVDLDVHVQSTIATTKVTQTFTNLSSYVLEQTSYSFPLYDGSAVISFRCHVGDDKLLEGVVKPKEVSP
jgi:Vault protein inter-alpha-trypsin domain